jgi:hypothetical protein
LEARNKLRKAHNAFKMQKNAHKINTCGGYSLGTGFEERREIAENRKVFVVKKIHFLHIFMLIHITEVSIIPFIFYFLLQ